MHDDASKDWSWGSVGDDGAAAAINLTTAMDKTAWRNDTPTYSEPAAQVAVGAVLSTLCLITVLGNTLVIHAVRTDRKLQTVGITHAAYLCFFCLYAKKR